eukprot:CAMPEP_0178443158 /NCGR_PEP_ID=MMETSP0689_2-20121128/38692_1 /TAXON_ID=160604 /ORGANISM="Amphidinium massartii, Strain CS-259" /LENGTH=263 /DNA_ID=CAMNT_0020067039 /DNA_START=63 /DNA_END=852 /DNA_ORIENTATION=+
MNRAIAVPLALLAGSLALAGFHRADLVGAAATASDDLAFVMQQPKSSGRAAPMQPATLLTSSPARATQHRAKLAGSSRSFSSSALILTAALALSASLLRRAGLVVRHADERQGWRIFGAPGRPGTPEWKIPDVRWCKRFKNRIAVRKHITGTCARPRLAVFKSRQHIHVNVVDDTAGTGVTIVASDTKQTHNLDALREKSGCGKGEEKTWSFEAAEVIGADIAKKCLEKNITQVNFDHGGFKYIGRVKVLAEAARAGGLQMKL